MCLWRWWRPRRVAEGLPQSRWGSTDPTFCSGCKTPPHQILWNSKKLPSASCRAVCVCLEAGKRSKLLWPPIALSACGTLCVCVSFVSHFVYFPRCSYLGNLKCTGRADADIFIFLEQTESSQEKHFLTIVRQPDEGNTLCLQITSYRKCGAPCNCG